MAARSARLPLDNPRVLELGKFSQGERETLLLFAPGAVPMFGKLLQHGEKLAGIMFGAAFLFSTLGALREVRALGALRAEEREATEASSSAA